MNDLNIFIELKSRVSISDDDERNIFGVKKFEIDIKRENLDNDEEILIGSASFIKIDTDYIDTLSTLDFLEETAIFTFVFKNDWEFTKEAKKLYEQKREYLDSPNGSIYFLDRIELDKEYRGLNLSKQIFNCIIKTLNINSEYILLKAFPLQYESTNENFDEKQFLIDRKKLIKLYSDWGFIIIYNDYSTSIMIKDTEYK